MFWKVKTHIFIKVCGLFGVLDDERHFFQKIESFRTRIKGT